MITKAKLQEELKKIEETIKLLQQTHDLIKHIDLKDYWLRDVRKIAEALWLKENKDYRGAVVSFAGERWSIVWGKEYSFQDYSRIRLLLYTPIGARVTAVLYKYEWTLAEQAHRYMKEVEAYRQALAQYDEYANKKQEREEYNKAAPYPLRYTD